LLDGTSASLIVTHSSKASNAKVPLSKCVRAAARPLKRIKQALSNRSSVYSSRLSTAPGLFSNDPINIDTSSDGNGDQALSNGDQEEGLIDNPLILEKELDVYVHLLLFLHHLIESFI
jgi:hypothetical protein